MHTHDTGGFWCPLCQQHTPHGNYHVCPKTAATTTTIRLAVMPAPWICPVCGNACAPWMDVCPGPHAGAFGRASDEDERQ
jgi:hypothetical protein